MAMLEEEAETMVNLKLEIAAGFMRFYDELDGNLWNFVQCSEFRVLAHFIDFIHFHSTLHDTTTEKFATISNQSSVLVSSFLYSLANLSLFFSFLARLLEKFFPMKML